MPYTTRTDFKGKTIKEIYEHMLWHLGMVVNGEVSYTRYPKALLRYVINQAQMWVNSRVPSIVKYAIVNTQAGYGWYKCPPNMMPNGILRAFYVKDSTTMTRLEMIGRDELTRKYPDWNITTTTGDPEYIVPSGQIWGNRSTFEIFPRPAAGGLWNTPNDKYGVGDAPVSVRTISHLADSGGTTYCVDMSASFTNMGIKSGMFIWNITDNAYAKISNVTATRITHSALSSGQSFGSGERYEVCQDYIGVICDWNNDMDDQYIYCAELPSISSLGAVTGNLVLEYLANPLEITRDDDYPQIKKELQDALLFKAIGLLASMGHEKVRMTELSDKYHLLAETEIQLYLGKQDIWPYNKPTITKVVPLIKEI